MLLAVEMLKPLRTDGEHFHGRDERPNSVRFGRDLGGTLAQNLDHVGRYSALFDRRNGHASVATHVMWIQQQPGPFAPPGPSRLLGLTGTPSRDHGGG